VFQQVVEVMLRQPLHPKAIAGLVGSFNFQIEFMSGREFGMRVRGEGLALLNRARDLLAGVESVSGGPKQ
jgi:hypothetical protein